MGEVVPLPFTGGGRGGREPPCGELSFGEAVASFPPPVAGSQASPLRVPAGGRGGLSR